MTHSTTFPASSPARGRLLLVLSLMALGSASCGGEGGTEPEAPRPTTVSISPATVTLSSVGETRNLTASVKDQNGSPMTGTIAWSSEATAVASVSATGTVTAVANGTATIRATSGSISGTATVTVQQVTTRLTIVSGDGQSALAGASAAEAVVVRAEDSGGAPVPGLAITFTPAAGSGTVSAASATTDAQGRASTTWTLGSAFGPQKLNISGGGLTAVANATSLSPVPLPDLVTSGTLALNRTDLTTLESVVAQVTVRNGGDVTTGQAVPARLLVDGQVAATLQVPPLQPGSSQALTFTLDPLTAGGHTLKLEVDPDNAVAELNEGDNVLQREVSVIVQTPVEAGATLTGLAGAEDTEILYLLELPFGANNLTVELSGGTGDVDLYIEGGDRPSVRDDFNDCQSGSPTTAERCQISPVTPGKYHILLHAFTAFSGTTMKVSLDGEVLPFDIEVVFLSHGTPRQDSAVIAAANKWMSFIKVDIPDSDFSANPYPPAQCAQGQPEVLDNVDDVRIYVRIDSIDGVSGTLAQAGPCVTRGLGHLTVLGSMQFDEADLQQLDEQNALFSVVLHEMAHVLGLGTVWDDLGLLQNPSLPSNKGADTHFTGARARTAFDAAGGSAYSGGQKVPVENIAGEGSGDSHWRESVLGVELMTPFFNGGVLNPISAITVESMADLGYQVDATGADTYTGSFSAASRAPGAEGPVIDLSGDVPRRPIVRVDRKGRVLSLKR